MSEATANSQRTLKFWPSSYVFAKFLLKLEIKPNETHSSADILKLYFSRVLSFCLRFHNANENGKS